MDEIMKINEEKIYSAYKSKIKLHLTLRDKTFRNGFVEEIKADYFLFKDDINGSEAIFFLELWNIEPAKEAKRWKLK